MEPPNELTRGPKFLRDFLNQLREFVIRTRPLAGDSSVGIQEGEAGTMLMIRSNMAIVGSVGNQFSCSSSRDGSGDVVLQLGVINGAGLSSISPDDPATALPMTGPTTLAVDAAGVVGILMEFEPDTQITSTTITVNAPDDVSSADVWGFSNGGTIVGTPEIKVYADIAAKDAARVPAVVNSSTGAVTTNLKEVVVIAKYTAGAQASPQAQYGPLQIAVCNGLLSFVGPSIN